MKDRRETGAKEGTEKKPDEQIERALDSLLHAIRLDETDAELFL